MELALTIFIWLISGVITIGVVAWFIVLLITVHGARRARKVVNKTADEMLRDIERILGGK